MQRYIFVIAVILGGWARGAYASTCDVAQNDCGANEVCVFVDESRKSTRCIEFPPEPSSPILLPFMPGHPVVCTQGHSNPRWSHHFAPLVFALDLATPEGLPPGLIRSAHEGLAVVFGGCTASSAEHVDGCGFGFGNHVKVISPNGIATLYAHLSEVYVAPGAWVKAGEILGLEGNTGAAFRRHLHFSVHRMQNSTASDLLSPIGYVGSSIPFSFSFGSEEPLRRVSSARIPCGDGAQDTEAFVLMAFQ